MGRQARRLWLTVRSRPELRLYLICNALWELSLGALKTFVVLYLTIGLGLGLTAAALIIGAVALLLLVASPVSGTMGDRQAACGSCSGRSPSTGSAPGPFLVASKAAIAAAVPFIAIGGGVVMTLPYALLMPLMDDEEHGALTGFYSVSRGIGTSVGPLLAGAAISLTSGVFDATKGFQATWGVCAAAVLASLLPLRRLRRLWGTRLEADCGDAGACPAASPRRDSGSSIHRSAQATRPARSHPGTPSWAADVRGRAPSAPGRRSASRTAGRGVQSGRRPSPATPDRCELSRADDEPPVDAGGIPRAYRQELGEAIHSACHLSLGADGARARHLGAGSRDDEYSAPAGTPCRR